MSIRYLIIARASLILPHRRSWFIKRAVGQETGRKAVFLNAELPSRSRTVARPVVARAPSGAEVAAVGANKNEQHPFPVMVYIHGESYEWNSGNPYDGSVLASSGRVVVVTVNYRLGVLGFLNTNESPHQRSITNYGLMDQIAALHWLKENIAEFGGDPDNVTMFGHGTGAACINFLMTSKAVPKNPKLFHRAILMSGSSLAPWALVNDPFKNTRRIAQALNCSDVPLGDELKKCLRVKNLHQIMQAQSEIPDYYFAFGPTVDGVVIDTDYDTDRQSYIGRLSSYALIFGVTPSDAFFIFNDDDVKFGLETDKRNKILRSFIRNTYNYHLTEIMATVINEYTDWERPVRHPISTRDETLALLSDALYSAPVLNTGSLHALSSPHTFLYVFDHQTRNGDFQHRVGCVHGEELAYLWGAPLVESLSYFPSNYTQSEVKLSETMLSYWTNFARTGNPNEPTNQIQDRSGEKNRYRLMEWPVYDGMHRKYLDIGLKSRVRDHYRSHQLSFWLQLVPQLHRAGKDAPEDHHHLENHNDWNSYRGFVRSEPVTRVILPPDTTTVATTTRQYNVSAVLQPTASGSDANKTGKQSHPSLSDGFAAYSTALSVTIAIGCSLLILNVLIFAGVYYQRDKSRMEAKKVAENGGLLAPAHSISGDVHTPPTPSLAVKAEVAARMSAAGMKAPPSTPMAQATHLPPPEFADYPSQVAHYGTAQGVSHLHTLPRGTSKHVTCEAQSMQGGQGSLTLSVPRAPPPPRVPCHTSEAQPLLKQTSFTLTSPSTNTSKSPSKDSNIGELRV
ncbi:neuroligin-1-like [Penaeus chinensis]|uniref:neuroligin-1-like n=1 Tax=Penaeus chinensis TaxID=139456 RepID=UPI001FB84B51|nr:neuroligin-1-like [Penaeus chinensis]